jgi:Kef-type K+ transport system membrane component KefB
MIASTSEALPALAGLLALPGVHLALSLALILAAARIGGELVERIGQPAVLGELLAGVLLGNLGFAGAGGLRTLATDVPIATLAQIGVMLLLFEVGLESTVSDMRKVGGRALLVAVLGVAAPWVLGTLVGDLFLPGRSTYTHLYLGAILTATSVGITARVLRDLGRAQSAEARIILGAAVIDDVLGLVILAVVGSLIAAANAGAAPSLGGVGWIVLRAALFLVGSLWLGAHLSPRLFGFAARLRSPGRLLATALVCCFGLAGAAAAVGLAPIVGAYAAGLILERVHYEDLARREKQSLEQLVRPIAGFLAPVFFVTMGLQVDLSGLFAPGQLVLGGALVAAAILGKQACALGGIGAPLDRLSIGLGMMPRGEVGLIFANIGLGLTVHGERIVDPALFSTVVLVVLVTTVVTPPALQWSLRRGARRESA